MGGAIFWEWPTQIEAIEEARYLSTLHRRRYRVFQVRLSKTRYWTIERFRDLLDPEKAGYDGIKEWGATGDATTKPLDDGD